MARLPRGSLAELCLVEEANGARETHIVPAAIKLFQVSKRKFLVVHILDADLEAQRAEFVNKNLE